MPYAQLPEPSLCDHYFEPVSRTQLREKLVHMIRFSDYLLSLSAEVGVGKTQFAIRLADSLQHVDHQVCVISAARTPETAGVVAAIISQLPEHLVDNKVVSPIEMLTEVIASLRHRGVRLLLVVDDAERLSEEALALLIELQLFHDHSDGLCPQVMLIGSVAFGEHLSAQAQEAGFAERHFMTDLVELQQDEVKQYLVSRFGERGKVQDKTLKALFKKTQGNFAALEAHFTKQSQTYQSARAFPFPVFHMVALAVCLVGVLGVSVWYFMPDDGLLVEQDILAQESPSSSAVVSVDSISLVPPLPLELNESESSDIKRDALTVQPKLVEQPVLLDAPDDIELASEPFQSLSERYGSKQEQSTSDLVVSKEPQAEESSLDALDVVASVEPVAVLEVAEPVTPLEENAVAEAQNLDLDVIQTPESPVLGAVDTVVLPSQKDEVVASAPVVESQVSQPAPETQRQVAQVQSVEPKPREEPPKPKAPAIVKKAESSLVNERIIADKARLLLIPSSGYTIQLLAAQNERSIEEFLTKWSALESIYVFQAVYRDKPFFVVVSGLYGTSAEAKEGVETLPEPIQALKPWPRSIRGVQSDLQKR